MNAMQCEKAVHLPHSSLQLSANSESSVCVCVCRGAQLFFNLRTEVREREVSRLLTWFLCSRANTPGPRCMRMTTAIAQED